MDQKKVIVFVLCLIMTSLNNVYCQTQHEDYISGEMYSQNIYKILDSLSKSEPRHKKFSFNDLENPLRFFKSRKTEKDMYERTRQEALALLNKCFVKDGDAINIICDGYDSLMDLLSFDQSCSVVALHEASIEEVPVVFIYTIIGSGIIREQVFIFKRINNRMCLSCVYTVPNSHYMSFTPQTIAEIDKWELNNEIVRHFL